MSAREKLLATLVGIAVVVLVLYVGVKNYVIDPRRDLVTNIDQRQQEIAKLRKKLKTLPMWREEWQSRTAATLGGDDHEVQSRFKEDVHRLLIEAGFRAPDVKAPKVSGHLYFGDAGFREVTLHVDVQGEIDKLERFLEAYYQRPYYNGIRRMTIDAPQGKKSRRDNAAPTEPVLDITLTATTLVLPDVLDIERMAFDEADPNGLEPRLARTPDAYDRLASGNPFKKWVKPAPPPPPPPTKREETKPPPVVTKPPPPPPNKTVVGVVAIEGRYYAYVRDDDHLEKAPDEVFIGAPMDDGEVMLIHPDGVVVRAPEKRGDDDGPLTDYFYPLGKEFAQREPLSEETRPHVYEVFARVYPEDAPASPE